MEIHVILSFDDVLQPNIRILLDSENGKPYLGHSLGHIARVERVGRGLLGRYIVEIDGH